MAAAINLSSLNFSEEQVRRVSELSYDAFIKAPAISSITSIYPNIITQKQIGFIGEGGLVGKAGVGCGLPVQEYALNVRPITWTPEHWYVELAYCYADLLGTAALYSLKTSYRIADFSASDYEAIVSNQLSESFAKFAHRLAWFNDKTAANVSAGGTITNGVDVDYFNIIDGLWKQLIAQTTVNANQRVAISANAQTTYATQVMAAADVIPVLQKLVYDAPMVLRQQAGATIYCTQKFYDAFLMAIQTLDLQSTYMNILNGNFSLSFGGIPIVAIPVWDEMIQAYENTGTKWNNPFRVIYTTKEILGFGVDAEASIGLYDVWFDKDSELVKIRAKGQADAKLLRPDLFMLGI